MSHDDDHLRHEVIESSRGRSYKVAAILFAIAGAAYGLFYNEHGTIIFSMCSSVMLLCSLVPPSELAPASLPRFVFRVNKRLRHAFQNSNKLVRVILIVISVGGTALVCKYGITGFSLLPPYLDVAVKRIGSFLAIICCVLYPTSMISNRIHHLSNVQLDTPVRRYEFVFYVAVLFLCITLFAAIVGGQTEIDIPSNADPNSPTIPKKETTVLPGFSKATVLLLAWICLIWLVWVVSLAACILSRFWEISWRQAATR